MTRPTIVWFRDDLRLADNPALSAARARNAPAIAVFVMASGATPERALGAAAKWWLHHSLRSLADSLGEIGVPLVLASGDPRLILPRIAAQCRAAAVLWNRRYDRHAAAVDDEVEAALAAAGTTVESFNGHLLNEPWQVTRSGGQPYRVFTPYWRSVRSRGAPDRPLPVPSRFPPMADHPAGESLDDWRLRPARPDWAARFPDHWQPGEAGARQRLGTFVDTVLDRYADGRDRPGLEATSRLSPHLRFGEIGPRAVWHAIALRDHGNGAGDKYLAEIGWREFSYHQLHHQPDLATVNIQSKFDRFPWQSPEHGLALWQQGLTGYPLVDAGMRELWATGWMHNRVRMVAASFLVKHLRIDWRHGEAWFWDTLVDADPASNPASWQWVAGSGADAAPFFRIFNPTLQGEKFDPDGVYVRRWVPELAALPSKWIHKPLSAPDRVLADAGLRPGHAYPLPMVDHAAARAAALAAWRSLDTAATHTLESAE